MTTLFSKKGLFGNAPSLQGFTMGEIVIGVGVIGVIASGIFVVLNPAKQMRDAQNAKRIVYIIQQQNAALSYDISTRAFPI